MGGFLTIIWNAKNQWVFDRISKPAAKIFPEALAYVEAFDAIHGIPSSSMAVAATSWCKPKERVGESRFGRLVEATR